MKELFSSIKEFFSYRTTIGIADVIDILLMALIIYELIRLIRTTSAARIAKAILAIVVLTWLTDVLKLRTVNWLLDRILEIGIIALVILFQPELRRLLERVGGKSVRELIDTKSKSSDLDLGIIQTVNACQAMSEAKIGALIVFERNIMLDEYFKSGTEVDAKLTSELLRNIFFPKAALHDGAVIIRDSRVAAAGCVLPLTGNNHLSSDLGTRHRAGVGMSENSDAVVIIVSEETGTISVATGGMLKRHLAPQTLEKVLRAELISDEKAEKKGFFRRVKEQLSGKEK
ncbi:MAG: diadenylate cyclase CdaA [Clostridia bacterium]|nr:diadenylate cyclase CdaA [Clostridia bacterium]